MRIIVAWNHVVMEETSIGLSDALTLMNVDHDRVQFFGGEIEKDENNIYIIVGVHLYTKFPLNYIVLQCEQPGSHWMGDKTLYEKFENSMGLWEISPKLADKWRTVGYESYYVPTRIPMHVFIDFGREPGPVRKDIDILFYGGKHPKRVEMERILRKRFPTKHIVFRYFNLFGEERERMIQRAKLVLNIHYWPEASLETHRIEYLMARAKCVVTERSKDPALDSEYQDAVVFTPYDEMPVTIGKLLDTPEKIEQVGTIARTLSQKHQFNVSDIKTALLGCLKNIKKN